MDQRLEAKKQNLQIPNQRSGTQKIKAKLHRFETLKSAYHKRIAETVKEQTIPILSKRKHKRFFSRSQ